jgi:aminoglycoside 6-adenylyltransferase
MRNSTVMQSLIVDFAEKDDRVRAVLLNGSRANPETQPDIYQDFDIVYVVKNIEEFTIDHSWITAFGNVFIQQLPDIMVIGERQKNGFGYLTIFDDGNRVDLTLFPLEKITINCWPDSLTICLLDKDNLFNGLPAPSATDYLIRKPIEKEFADSCNEFWWVSTYVVKGLLRDEITYAKEMTELNLRPMLMKLLEWKVGCDNGFSVSFGKSGKNMKKYLAPGLYNNVLNTYSDSIIENNWAALLLMADIFAEVSGDVANKLGFMINYTEQNNAKNYLLQHHFRRVL